VAMSLAPHAPWRILNAPTLK